MTGVMHGYAELAATTNFSFLRGASHPEELVAAAMALGLAGLGVADRNSLAGVVRAHGFERANRRADFRLAIGARLVFCDGAPDILSFPTRSRRLWPPDAAFDARQFPRAKRRLPVAPCRSLRGGRGPAAHRHAGQHMGREDGARQAAKIYPDLHGSDLYGADLYDEHQNITPDAAALERLREAAGGRVWLAATMSYGKSMRRDLGRRIALAERLRLPLLAVNDALMHVPARRALLDVLTAIRDGRAARPDWPAS